MSALVLNFPQTAPRRRSLIGKLAMRNPVPTLQGVIAYLDNCARIARFTHNLDAERGYARAVEFVLLHTHGAIPLIPLIPVPVFKETPPVNREIPGWKLAVLARPMRKVLKHWEVEVWSGRRGYRYKMRRLKLSCGHLMDEQPISSADLVPQRRRCRECAQEAARKHAVPISRKVGTR